MRPLEYKGLGQHGRLGNMLWQIAGTVGVARSLGRDPQVRPDWPYRPFFSLPEDWYGERPSESVTNHVVGSRWRVRYMQDASLWAHCTDEIAAAFSPSARAMAVMAALPEPGEDDVAIHVRRGDYATMPDHLPMLSVRYYAAASERFWGPYGQVDATDVHVYGEDPDWIMQSLPWEWRRWGADDSGDLTDWCDLMMMSRYRMLVIANSSYSWWSAWLAGPEALVVAPEPWFGPAIDVPSPALPHWIKVDA